MSDNKKELEELKKQKEQFEALKNATAGITTQNRDYKASIDDVIAAIQAETAAVTKNDAVAQQRLKTIKDLYIALSEIKKIESDSNVTNERKFLSNNRQFELDVKTLELTKKILEERKKLGLADTAESEKLPEIFTKLTKRAESQNKVNTSIADFTNQLVGSNSKTANFISSVALSSEGLMGLFRSFKNNIDVVGMLGSVLVNLGVAIIDKIVVASFKRAKEMNELLATSMKESSFFISNEFVASMREAALATDLSANSAKDYKSSLQTLGIFEENQIKARRDLAISSAVAREAINGTDAASKQYATSIQRTAAQLEKLGLSVGETSKLIDTFTLVTRNANKSAESIEKQLEAFAVQAQTIGVPLKTFASDFGTAMNSLAAQGTKAMDVFLGLEKRAKTLGIEMNTLLQTVGQYDTFESAANAAGSLNAILGGDYLNSVELLNATEEQRVDILRRSLEMSGRSFETLDKYQQKAIASALGISNLSDANKLFSNRVNESSAETVKFSKMMEAATSASEKFENGFKKLGTMFEPFMRGLNFIADGFSSFTDFIAKNAAVAIILALVIIGGGFFLLFKSVQFGIDAFKALNGVVKQINDNLEKTGTASGVAAVGITAMGEAAKRAGAEPEGKPKEGEESGPLGSIEAPEAPDLEEAAETADKFDPKKLGEFAQGLVDAAKIFKNNAGDLLKGFAILALVGFELGLGLVAILYAVKLATGDASNAAMLVPIAFSIYLMAKVFKEVADIKFDLSKAATFGLFMLGIGGGLYLLGVALQQFKEIDLATLGIVSLVIVALGGLVFGLGALIGTGAGGAMFAFGLLALVGLALALNVLGKAMGPLAQAAKTLNEATGSGLAKNLTEVGTSLTALNELLVTIDDSGLEKLSNMASSFESLSGSLGIFVTDIESFIESFKSFSENVVSSSENLGAVGENISKISEAIDKLSEKTDALGTIGEAMDTAFASVGLLGLFTLNSYALAIEDIAAALELLPIDRLNSLVELQNNLKGETIFKEIKEVTTEQLNSAAGVLKNASEYNTSLALLGAANKTMSKIGDTLQGMAGAKKEEKQVFEIHVNLDGKEIKKIFADAADIRKTPAADLGTGR